MEGGAFEPFVVTDVLDKLGRAGEDDVVGQQDGAFPEQAALLGRRKKKKEIKLQDEGFVRWWSRKNHRTHWIGQSRRRRSKMGCSPE